MYKGKTFLAVIPARGGSKGVPGKNLKKANGKPLIAWTIGQAKKSKYLDRVVVSSEDPKIIRAARRWGAEAPFVRPANLSGDRVSAVEVARHALREIPGYDYLVLLQPTSPLRSAADIDGAIQFCTAHGAAACVSVCETDKSPYWCYALVSRTLKPFLPPPKKNAQRQDLPKAYALNGAVFLARSRWFQKRGTFMAPRTLGYLMPRERSLDIDSRWDFEIFRFLINKRKAR